MHLIKNGEVTIKKYKKNVQIITINSKQNSTAGVKILKDVKPNLKYKITIIGYKLCNKNAMLWIGNKQNKTILFSAKYQLKKKKNKIIYIFHNKKNYSKIHIGILLKNPTIGDSFIINYIIFQKINNLGQKKQHAPTQIFFRKLNILKTIRHKNIIKPTNKSKVVSKPITLKKNINLILSNKYNNNILLVSYPEYKLVNIYYKKYFNNKLKRTILNNSLNNYFKNIYYINLNHRTDRKIFLEIQFKLNNITNYTRFPAIKPNFDNININMYKGVNIYNKNKNNYSQLHKNMIVGKVGCKLSHLAIIIEAKKNNYDNIIIFEDDIIINQNINTIFNNVIENIKKNKIAWDMLYFGGNHTKLGFNKIKNINNLVKLNGSLSTYAYAINNTMYDILINGLNNYDSTVDRYYMNIHKKYNCYCIHPHLIKHLATFSDIENKFYIFSGS